MNKILLYKKTERFNLLSENRDVILNRAKDYYENDKERLGEQARDKYIWKTYLKKKKNKKREYGKSRYHNMSEEKTKTKRIAEKLSRGKKVSM